VAGEEAKAGGWPGGATGEEAKAGGAAGKEAEAGCGVTRRSRSVTGEAAPALRCRDEAWAGRRLTARGATSEGGGATLDSPSEAGRRPSKAALSSAGEAALELGGAGEVALGGRRAGRHTVERPSSSVHQRAMTVVPDAIAYGKFPLTLADHYSLRAVAFLRPVQRCGTNCMQVQKIWRTRTPLRTVLDRQQQTRIRMRICVFFRLRVRLAPADYGNHCEMVSCVAQRNQ
jgi:hypothetical protein